MADGYNLFRVAFAMERLVADELTKTASADYLANLTSTINYITDNGATAILDPYVIHVHSPLGR